MKKLTEVFESFKDKKVLIIGDVMIDSYVFGSKKKIENVPSPVLKTSRSEKRLGGAANVALNIQSLGATPILCSVVGDDNNGRTFERLLHEQGMPNRGIIRSQNRITTNKLRILSGSQQLIRVDFEEVYPLIDLDRKALLNHTLDLIEEIDLILFQDYDKGTIFRTVVEETIKIAEKNSIPIAVDPGSQNFDSYTAVSLFKPSILEMEKVIGSSIDERDEQVLKQALLEVDEKIGAGCYLISLDDGSIFFQSGDYSFKTPPFITGVSDMSGVGNAVLSLAGLCLAAGLDGEEIAALSSLTAGTVANYSGVVPIEKEQLLKQASKSDILQKYF